MLVVVVVSVNGLQFSLLARSRKSTLLFAYLRSGGCRSVDERGWERGKASESGFLKVGGWMDFCHGRPPRATWRPTRH